MKKNIMYIVLFSIGLLFNAENSFAQWDTTWIQTYGGNRDDNAMDMVVTDDNGFLIIGSTSSFGFDNSQMYFLKLDSAGNIMWSKSHGGDGQEWGTSVIKTSDNGYLGVGYTSSWGAGGFDVFIVKLDVNGNLEYEAVHGGVDWDFAWDVIEPTPGKYVIAAETQSFGNGNSDGWLLQFDDATRTIDWETTIGTEATENLKSVTKGNNSDFFAVGLGHSTNRIDDDIMLIRFSANGDSLNSYFYGDTLLDYGNDLIQLNDSNIAITGVHEVSGVNPGIAVLKVDTLGGIVFDTLWSSFQSSEGMAIMEIDSLRIAITGTVEIYPGNTDIFAGYTYPGNYYPQISATLGSLDEDQGIAFQFLGADGFIFSGTTNGYENSFSEILLFKTNKLCFTDNNDFKINKDSSTILNTNALSKKLVEVKYISALNEICIQNSYENFHFELFDLMGKKIISGNLSIENPFSLTSKNLSSGYYVISAISMNGLQQIQLLIFIP